MYDDEGLGQEHIGRSVSRGILMNADAGGVTVLVLSAADAGPVKAETLVTLGETDVGSEVFLAFEDGHLKKPVVLGKIRRGGEFVALPDGGVDLDVDGKPKRLEITAAAELTLRCGKASITLTRSGKIILRGTYISSRSSGVIRIKGGSVQIN